MCPPYLRAYPYLPTLNKPKLYPCSVVEEELRGIAREIKRQQAPAPRRPAIPLPRASSRPAVATRRQGSNGGLRRQSSGPTAAAAAAAAAAELQRQPSSSSFLLRQRDSKVAPASPPAAPAEGQQ